MVSAVLKIVKRDCFFTVLGDGARKQSKKQYIYDNMAE
jgi:hypothetical protein